MRKIAKSLLALLLAAAMVFSLSGCYNENLTWAAEYDGERLPVGAYLYFLSDAYSEMAQDLSTEEKVLSAEKDGQKAEDWIRAQAEMDMRRYFFVKSELARLGAPANEADEASASSMSGTYWSLLETTLTNYGISKDSFQTAFAMYQQLRLRLFQTLYGTGGEKEVPEAELREQYLNSYYSYEYFSESTYAYDDENNYVERPEEEITALKENFEQFAEEIRAGAEMASVSAEYAEENGKDDTYTTGSGTEEDLTSAYLPEDLVSAIREMEEGEVRVVELSSNFVVVRKIPNALTVEQSLENESTRLGLLLEIAEDDFDAYLDENAANLSGITLNDAAIKSCDLNRFAKTSPNGTKADPTEEPETEGE